MERMGVSSRVEEPTEWCAEISLVLIFLRKCFGGEEFEGRLLSSVPLLTLYYANTPLKVSADPRFPDETNELFIIDFSCSREELMNCRHSVT